MNLGLRNSVAVVAGASSGLGKAVAFGLSSEGCKVSICSRNNETINAVSQEIENATGNTVLACSADLTKKEQIQRFIDGTVKKFGNINILVCNAGGPPATHFEETDENLWDDSFVLNLKSAIRLTYSALPSMKKAVWGRIIFITSISVKSPIDGLILSNVSRAGVAGLSKTLSKELAQYNILVNTVCPGFISTQRTLDLARTLSEKRGISPQDVEKSFVDDIPLNRMGTPEEFANLVVFLASDKASYITGNAIQIDGGKYPGLL